MQKQPTYSAQEIKKLCATIQVDYIGFVAIRDIIEEEIELYSAEDLAVLCEASLIMFTRCLLSQGIKYL